MLGRHVHTIPWNKIYKREFLINNDIFFPNLKEQEDMVFVLLCCVKAQKTFFSKATLVKATVRDGSLSRNMSSVNVQCCVDVFEHVRTLLEAEQLLTNMARYYECYQLRTSAYILLMSTNRVRCNLEFWKGVSIIKTMVNLRPKSWLSLVTLMKVSTCLSIVVANSSILLFALRRFRKLGLMRGY